MVEKNNSATVRCLRDNKWVDLWSNNLVPGDIIHIPEGSIHTLGFVIISIVKT